MISGAYTSSEKAGLLFFKRTAVFLYKENHALDAWFRRAYGDEQKILLR